MRERWNESPFLYIQLRMNHEQVVNIARREPTPEQEAEILGVVDQERRALREMCGQQPPTKTKGSR